MRLDLIEGKRVGILGAGREGLAALAVLSERLRRPDLTVLVETGSRPDDWPGWTGPFDQRLQQFDLLLRSPGVPVEHPALVAARQAGVAVLNPASIWFSERSELPVIGVTGSKGKSTTASLLASLLEASGRRVLLAGNIGRPLLADLDTKADIVVVELSSYQLTDLEGALAMGLITRLFDEHLDWHGSRQAYFSSKLRIARLLQGRPLLINANDELLAGQTGEIEGLELANKPPGFHRRGDELWLGNTFCLALNDLNLVGRHNLDNAALALAAATWWGDQTEPLLNALREFRPLRHRLEALGRVGDHDWINDSISTSPHATRAALETLHGRAVVLIVGGQDRPADWQPVIDWCRHRRLAGLVALPDNGQSIVETLRQEGCVDPEQVVEVVCMDEAVRAAASLGGAEGVVLLSPGAPSFPHFRDFEDRGEAFAQGLTAYRDRSTA